MLINNCQVIQESWIDCKSNALYTQLREQDLGFFRAITVFKLLNDRQTGFRELGELIMFKLSYNMSTEKFEAIQKFFFIMSMGICRIAVRLWHPSRDILPISCEAWRLLLVGNF